MSRPNQHPNPRLNSSPEPRPNLGPKPRPNPHPNPRLNAEVALSKQRFRQWAEEEIGVQEPGSEDVEEQEKMRNQCPLTNCKVAPCLDPCLDPHPNPLLDLSPDPRPDQRQFRWLSWSGYVTAKKSASVQICHIWPGYSTVNPKWRLCLQWYCLLW